MHAIEEDFEIGVIFQERFHHVEVEDFFHQLNIVFDAIDDFNLH